MVVLFSNATRYNKGSNVVLFPNSTGYYKGSMVVLFPNTTGYYKRSMVDLFPNNTRYYEGSIVVLSLTLPNIVTSPFIPKDYLMLQKFHGSFNPKQYQIFLGSMVVLFPNNTRYS